MPVVVVDNLLSVIYASVADLDGIVAEDFSRLVIFREVFVYQGDGFMIDIGVDIFAKWRVVPMVLRCLFLHLAVVIGL